MSEILNQKGVKSGALIVDLRTVSEFNEDHIPGSLNIPISNLINKIDMLKSKAKPILLCCSDGTRSRMALALFKSAEFEIYDVGSYENLK